jgi:hypothetical protein
VTKKLLQYRCIIGRFSRLTMARTGIYLTVATLVAIHAALLAWSAKHQAVTFDEAAHLAAGCAYWSGHEMAVYSHSPPLLRYVGALPAVLMGAHLPDVSQIAGAKIFIRHFDFARAFSQLNRDRYPRMVFAGRLAMIPISCAGLLIVFAWARSLWGTFAGLGAAAIWTFEPNVLAFGSIVGTDLGTAVFCALAAWCWWRYLDQPTRARRYFAALALAAAVLCKFSALMLIPALILLYAFAYDRGGREKAKALRGSLLTAFLVTWLAIGAAYQFRRFGFFYGTTEFYSHVMHRLQWVLPRYLWIPLPKDFAVGFDVQKAESDAGGPSFWFGDHYDAPRWDYYPVALLTKVPPELLLLLIAAIVWGGIALSKNLKPGKQLFPTRHMAYLLPGGMLLCIGWLSNLNLGIRYLLPAWPFAIVAVAGLFSLSRIRALAVLAVIALAAETLVQAPRFLTYASPLMGGPATAWQRVLVDFDWSQGVADLARWQHRTGSGRIGIALLACTDPSIYGLDFVPADEMTSERFVAVDTLFLEGFRRGLPLPHGGMTSHAISIWQWQQLWSVKPVAIADDCIYVYSRADFDAALKRTSTQPANAQ